MKRANKLLLMSFSILISLLLSILLLIFFNINSSSIDWVFWLFFSLYFFQIIVSFIIFSSKRRFEVKASWLLILNIPIIGLFAFLTVGLIPFEIKSINQMKKNKKIISTKEDFSFTKKFIIENKSDPMVGIYKIQDAPIYKNNNIKFIYQKDLVKESIELIKRANKTINIQFYIISNSKWLNLITNELIKKSKEGVTIKIMIDYIGSYKKYSIDFLKKLKKNKIQYSFFNSTKFMKLISSTNFRNHRKSIIVDNKYCLTGGSNIGDEYINLRKKYFYWKDINFFIEGESVHSLNLQFYYDWYNESTKRNTKNKLLNEIEKLDIYKSEKNNGIVQIIHSEPYAEYKLFSNVLDKYNSKAKKRIWIYTPYFASHLAYIESLILASMSGIDVRIILPGKPDNKKIILSINRSIYKRLILSNIKIYEYDGFTHSKGIIIDDNISILGSNNLDMRSLFINFETALIVNSKEINKSLSEDFINDFRNSQLFDLDRLSSIFNRWEKIKMKFINIFYGIL